MSFDANALRLHAALVSSEQLTRANGRLRALAPDEQDTVAELAQTIARGIARCLLDEAKRNAALGEALAAIYGRSDHGASGRHGGTQGSGRVKP